MLKCDYLVVGAGAGGLAFVDRVLSEAKVSKCKVGIVIVDRRSEPGGHWNDAYSFARLHHESTHYGVSSKRLERPRPKGANGGDYASKAQILSYYSEVMNDFVDSGCVQFFPMCTFRNDRVESFMDPDLSWKIPPNCKIVETSFANIRVPNMRTPPFEVSLGTCVVPPNHLPSIVLAPSKYCVIGAGRTAIDVVLWLLSMGVKPSKLQWVMPRDHWFMCREAIDGNHLLEVSLALEREAAVAKSLEELTERAEMTGLLCRLDRNRSPECFHGAAVSKEELAKLRSISDIVRLGHVLAVRKDELVLDSGVVPVAAGTLHVDCTSSWIREAQVPVPIWQGRRIILQPVQEVFVGPGEFNVPMSTAMIGMVESLSDKDAIKNSMCTPGRYPDKVEDWFRMHACANDNSKALWTQARIGSWLTCSRLSLISAFTPDEVKRYMGLGETRLSKSLASLLAADDEAHAEEAP